MKNCEGENLKDLFKLGKDNIIPLVTQALPDEVKVIQGTLNPLIQLKD
jgi:hypothetical protein